MDSKRDAHCGTSNRLQGDSPQYDFRFHRYGFRCGYSSSFPSLHTLCKQLLCTGHRYTGWANTVPAVPNLQKFHQPHSRASSTVRQRQCRNPASAAVWVKIAANLLQPGIRCGQIKLCQCSCMMPLMVQGTPIAAAIPFISIISSPPP